MITIILYVLTCHNDMPMLWGTALKWAPATAPCQDEALAEAVKENSLALLDGILLPNCSWRPPMVNPRDFSWDDFGICWENHNKKKLTINFMLVFGHGLDLPRKTQGDFPSIGWFSLAQWIGWNIGSAETDARFSKQSIDWIMLGKQCHVYKPYEWMVYGSHLWWFNGDCGCFTNIIEMKTMKTQCIIPIADHFFLESTQGQKLESETDLAKSKGRMPHRPGQSNGKIRRGGMALGPGAVQRGTRGTPGEVAQKSTVGWW